MKRLRTANVVSSLIRPPDHRQCSSFPSKNHHRLASQPHRSAHGSAYALGTQWTGALSRPSREDEAPELTSAELLAGGVQNLVPMELPCTPCDDGHGNAAARCVTGSAGWGHSALIVESNCGAEHAAVANENDDADNNNKPSTNYHHSRHTKLLVCGRPHDFQTLMRLRRLPTPLRNLSLSANSPISNGNGYDTSSNHPSMLQKIVSYLAGENQLTIHEEECRKYSFIDKLTEISLPNNQMPALPGQAVTDYLLNLHGRKRYIPHHPQSNNDNNTTLIKSHHATFQNTLATSAGLTAVISNTGNLYTFGLNHRGQCGVGTFSPNVWTPSPVVGLASLRFILDYTAAQSSASFTSNNNNSAGSHVYSECKVQEYPMVSVALGLQHGLALDCMGQVFTWGKGERGQLGLGKRFMYESLQEVASVDPDVVMQYKKDNDASITFEEPNQNKTLEYAMQITNFYDPYATLSLEKNEDIYAPLLSSADSTIRLIGAGMNFSMAVTESNLPYIWGKNCVHNNTHHSNGIINNPLQNISKPVLDSTYPRYIPGLPPNVQIIQVACGTHHASMLLEDGSIYAVGVATDQPIPMWNEAVEILPKNIVDVSSLISFSAGFDRTFVVYGDEFGGREVIEIQLWSEEEMRLNGLVRPSWCDWLEEEEEDGRKRKVRSVHRGWMHTVVITEE
ncbi:hypothetical protein ACHAXN_011157 [Cyclotella atomus]